MGNGELVLVVEDDPTVLESISDLLQLSGYSALTASDGLEALQLLDSAAPEIIVSDIMMPNMDGYEFHDAVRAKTSWSVIPFIFLTAKGEQKDIRQALKMGVDSYITKPFEPEDLIIAVESRISRKHEVVSALQREVEETKRRILNVFSHELRTPLFVLYGAANLLNRSQDSLTPEARSKLVRLLNQGAKRLVRLVEDLLLLAYLDSGLVGGSDAEEFEELNLLGLLRSVIDELAPETKSHQVQVELECDQELLVSGHPLYLPDLFNRLIDNAVKFSRPGGEVHITASRNDEILSVAIQDEGIGIPPEKIGQIFASFEQVDREKMEQQGAGLGLPIAFDLVKLHRGDLNVHSEVGRGSTFTVRLPLGESSMEE